METKFDPKAKVKQGDLGTAPDGKQPNQEPTNIDFSKHAPGKYQSKNYLDLEGTYTTKSGKEHVQDSLFKLADQKDY
tara:strand:- start:1595 stop:1825 length:231 start_codon:yes stop_codon:yes gene_type:complete